MARDEVSNLARRTETLVGHLSNFRGGFQALEDVVLVGSPWMADEA
jgi:hypothetical protein